MSELRDDVFGERLDIECHVRPSSRFPYRITQVRYADSRGHRRIAEDGRRAGEMVEEANAGAEKHRGDVDGQLVEKSNIQ